MITATKIAHAAGPARCIYINPETPSMCLLKFRLTLIIQQLSKTTRTFDHDLGHLKDHPQIVTHIHGDFFYIYSV